MVRIVVKSINQKKGIYVTHTSFQVSLWSQLGGLLYCQLKIKLRKTFLNPSNSCNFHTLTPILKLEMTTYVWFAITNQMTPLPLGSNSQKFVQSSWEYPHRDHILSNLTSLRSWSFPPEQATSHARIWYTNPQVVFMQKLQIQFKILSRVRKVTSNTHSGGHISMR